LAVRVCLCGPFSLPWNLIFCNLRPLQSLKTPMGVSLQSTSCIYVGAASRLPLGSASFSNSFKTESSVQNGALLQCRLPDIGNKVLPRVPFEPCTDELLSDRHVDSKSFTFGPSYTRASAQVFKLFLLVSVVHMLCYSMNVSYLLQCCSYLSFELFSKGGCVQC